MAIHTLHHKTLGLLPFYADKSGYLNIIDDGSAMSHTSLKTFRKGMAKQYRLATDPLKILMGAKQMHESEASPLLRSTPEMGNVITNFRPTSKEFLESLHVNELSRFSESAPNSSHGSAVDMGLVRGIFSGAPALAIGAGTLDLKKSVRTFHNVVRARLVSGKSVSDVCAHFIRYIRKTDNAFTPPAGYGPIINIFFDYVTNYLMVTRVTKQGVPRSTIHTEMIYILADIPAGDPTASTRSSFEISARLNQHYLVSKGVAPILNGALCAVKVPDISAADGEEVRPTYALMHSDLTQRLMLIYQYSCLYHLEDFPNLRDSWYNLSSDVCTERSHFSSLISELQSQISATECLKKYHQILGDKPLESLRGDLKSLLGDATVVKDPRLALPPVLEKVTEAQPKVSKDPGLATSDVPALQVLEAQPSSDIQIATVEEGAGINPLSSISSLV